MYKNITLSIIIMFTFIINTNASDPIEIEDVEQKPKNPMTFFLDCGVKTDLEAEEVVHLLKTPLTQKIFRNWDFKFEDLLPHSPLRVKKGTRVLATCDQLLSTEYCGFFSKTKPYTVVIDIPITESTDKNPVFQLTVLPCRYPNLTRMAFWNPHKRPVFLDHFFVNRGMPGTFPYPPEIDFASLQNLVGTSSYSLACCTLPSNFTFAGWENVRELPRAFLLGSTPPRVLDLRPLKSVVRVGEHCFSGFKRGTTVLITPEKETFWRDSLPAELHKSITVKALETAE